MPAPSSRFGPLASHLLTALCAAGLGLWMGRQVPPQTSYLSPPVPLTAAPPPPAPPSAPRPVLGMRTSGLPGSDDEPLNALEAGVSQSGTDFREMAAHLAALMEQDPAAALAELGALAPSLRMSLAPTVLTAGAAKAPTLCAQWMLEHLPTRALLAAAQPFAEAWVAKSPREALTWLFAQSEAANDLLGPFFAAPLASPSGAGATALLMGLPPGTARDRLVPSVVAAWARREPAAASQWALSQGSELPRAMAAAVRTWAEEDATAAAQWLKGLAASPATDQGLIGLSDHLVQIDAPVALAWSAKIGDAATRTNQQRVLLDQWMGLDGAAAERWLRADQSLPAELRREALSSQASAPLTTPGPSEEPVSAPSPSR